MASWALGMLPRADLPLSQAEEEARTYAKYENAVKILERKERGEDTSVSTRDYTDIFSRITTETNRLVEIMDIQDELNIVDSVLLAQKTVLERLVQPVNDTTENDEKGGPAVKTKETALGASTRIHETIQIVKQNRSSVADMIKSAKRVQDDLKQLLDFKQQQSSAWEMRYSRKLAQQGQDQNNVRPSKSRRSPVPNCPQIMLIFTLVTIVFVSLTTRIFHTVKKRGQRRSQGQTASHVVHVELLCHWHRRVSQGPQNGRNLVAAWDPLRLPL